MKQPWQWRRLRGCHNQMDTLGLGLKNYEVMGASARIKTPMFH
jgi:hypothetical protein